MHWITPGEPSARSQKGFTVFPRLSKIKTKQNKTNKKPQKKTVATTKQCYLDPIPEYMMNHTPLRC